MAVRGGGGGRGYVRGTLAWQPVALEARLHRDVVDDVATAATLDADPSGLRPDRRRRDDDPGHLHQPRHLLRLARRGAMT